MADQSITHVLPVFSAPLPGQKPEEHLASYDREVKRSFTKVWQELQDAKAQIQALQAQMKGKSS